MQFLFWKSHRVYININLNIYIYKYIYTRFANGTWRCLWSRAKHSSKQCEVRSRATSKGISKGTPQETRKRCRIQRRLLEPRLRALTLGRRLRVLPNTEKRARAVISNGKWLRGTPEQRFRAVNGCGARPSSDFERKARPVWCFQMLSAWLGAFHTSQFERRIYYIIIHI